MGQEQSQTLAEGKNCTSQEIITYMRKLVKMDTEYCHYVRQSVDHLIVQRQTYRKKPGEVSESLRHPETVKIAGSCSQGGGICRWFKHGPLEIEVDINNQVRIILLFSSGS